MAKKLFQRIDASGRNIDDEDDDGVIKNGQGVRVSMMMMDSLQQAVFADATARGAHRAGYQSVSNGLVSDARNQGRAARSLRRDGRAYAKRLA